MHRAIVIWIFYQHAINQYGSVMVWNDRSESMIVGRPLLAHYMRRKDLKQFCCMYQRLHSQRPSHCVESINIGKKDVHPIKAVLLSLVS